MLSNKACVRFSPLIHLNEVMDNILSSMSYFKDSIGSDFDGLTKEYN